ncbi:hypothetical protein Bca101_073784 [Brassica carinata]
MTFFLFRACSGLRATLFLVAGTLRLAMALLAVGSTVVGGGFSSFATAKSSKASKALHRRGPRRVMFSVFHCWRDGIEQACPERSTSVHIAIIHNFNILQPTGACTRRSTTGEMVPEIRICESIQYVDSAEAVVNSPELVKPAERRKWSTKEDLVLISAWLNTSKDPIVSNEHKLGDFWKRIEAYFNSSPQLIGSLPREWGQCKQRWGRVNAEVCRFVGSHETALKEQASGQSENDVMKTAHDIYFNDYNLKFTLEQCWRELRFDQKWRSHSQPKEKRKEAGAEAVPEEEEEVRPPGVKASKAAKRKKPNEAAYDHIHSILAEKNTISRQKILDRLLAKNIDTLSDNEVALKNKLISEML